MVEFWNNNYFEFFSRCNRNDKFELYVVKKSDRYLFLRLKFFLDTSW